MKESLLRFGVIGSGYWGPKLARNIHEIPGAELVMISDLHLSRLNDLQKIYPHVITTTNYQDLNNRCR